MVDIEKLVGNPRNPNKHPRNQIELPDKIIKAQGWRNPIVVSKRSGFVVKGHGRLAATRLLGLEYAGCAPDDRSPGQFVYGLRGNAH